MIENSILENNLNEIVSYYDFFCAFGYQDRDTIYLRTFDDTKAKRGGHKKEVELSRFRNIIPSITKENEDKFCVAFVVNGGGQDDKQVKQAKAHFIDFDEFSFEKQIEKLNDFSLEPSIIIKTKKSLHCYWLLQDGDIKLFRDIQIRLNKYFESDESIKNESRPMRLYGFKHQKAEPVEVKLIKFSPELKYTQKELDAILPKVTKEKPKGKPETMETVHEGSRTDYLISQIGCFANKVSDAEVLKDFIKALNQTKNNPPLTEKELEREVFPAINRFLESDSKKGGALDIFHHLKNGIPTGVYDYKIFEYIKENHPMVVLGGVVYHYEHGVYVADDTGARLKTMIRELIYPEFVKSNTIRRIYDLFLTDHELETSYAEVNCYPSHWINFRNAFYDPKEKKLIEHDAGYKAINQIAFDYIPNIETEGAFVENWLHFAIPDQEDLEMFLQYSGLCMTKDVSMQKFLLICGEGGTGKSTAIRLNEAVIGTGNISNISLSELNQRFASYGLMGKLMNSCADLEISALEDTSTLKKCLGEDSLRAEKKGADAISFKNYSKLIFSTNELPVIKGERSNGFFRRLLVLNMNEVPKQKDAALFGKLANNLEHYIRLCVSALERMYETGCLFESNNSKISVEQMRCDSDSVQAFLMEETHKDSGGYVERGLLYAKYERFCNETDRRVLIRNNFYKALRTKGYTDRRDGKGRYFKGLSLGSSDRSLVTKSDTCADEDGFEPIGSCEKDLFFV